MASLLESMAGGFKGETPGATALSVSSSASATSSSSSTVAMESA